MKKTLFAILAVLFTIALIATCDLFEEPLAANGDLPKTTPSGRPLVTVTLNVEGLGIGDLDESASRKLTLEGDDGARKLVSNFSVAFLDPDNAIIETTFNIVGSVGSTSVNIPVGNYPSPSKAVVFAGTNNTLLAVGNITNISPSSGTNNYIGTDCTVTFTLTALRSENDGATGFVFPSGISSSTTDIPGITVYEISRPGTTSSTNTQFKIGWGTSNNSEGVFITTAWTVTSAPPIELAGSIGTGTTGTVSISNIPNVPITGTMMSSLSSSFSFDFTPPSATIGDNVYSKIYINIPVRMINTDGSAGSWNIRGGVENDTIESSSNTRGGAVVLHSQYKRVTVGIIVDNDQTK